MRSKITKPVVCAITNISKKLSFIIFLYLSFGNLSASLDASSRHDDIRSLNKKTRRLELLRERPSRARLVRCCGLFTSSISPERASLNVCRGERRDREKERGGEKKREYVIRTLN